MQPYLLRKCLGYDLGGLAVPSQEVFGSIGNNLSNNIEDTNNLTLW